MKDLDRNIIKTKIQKTLNEIEPKNLNTYLWEEGFQSTQGPPSKDYLIKKGYFASEVVEYCDDNRFHDSFLEFYLEWKMYESNRLLEEDEEIKSIENEDERFEVSHEWSDSDGFVYIGFLNLIYYLTGVVINDINSERTDNYQKKLNDLGFWTWYNERNYDEYLRSYIPTVFEISGYIDCDPVVEFKCEINMNGYKFKIYTYEEISNDEYSETVTEFETFNEFYSQLNKLKNSSEVSFITS